MSETVEKSVESEISSAVKLKPKKKEGRQDFLYRLITAAGDSEILTDELWDKLSTAAQKWINKSVEAHKAGKEIPEPDEADEDDSSEQTEAEVEAEADTEEVTAEGETEGSEETEPEEEVKPAKAAKAAKEVKEPKAPAKAAKKAESGEARPPSSRRRMKEIIIRNPGMTAEEVLAQLNEEGLTPSKMTVNTTRNETKDTMKIILELGGKLPPNVKL